MVNFPVLKAMKVGWGREQKCGTCRFIFGNILGDMGDLAVYFLHKELTLKSGL